MVMGIIILAIGCLVFLVSFLMEPLNAPQQTVQYLSYVCSTLLFCTGFICIKLNSVSNEIQGNMENLARTNKHLLETTVSSSSKATSAASNSSMVSGDTWTCKNCGEVNKATSSSCKGCGSYK